MRLRLPALAGLAFAALLLAPAAGAAHDPDWEGWFFQLDAAMLTPGNTNTPLIATAPSAFNGGSVRSNVEYMDWDDDLAFRLGFGYSFGSGGTLRVSYWSYDSDEDNDGSLYAYYTGPEYVWWTVGPATNIGYTYSYETAWKFDQEIEATTIDLEYLKTNQATDSLSVTYGVGLRAASFEEELKGGYTVDPNGSAFRFPAMRTVDSDGFGFTGSVGVNYDFTDIVGIGSNLRVGFLTADVEADHQVTDLDFYYLYASYPTSPDSITESSEAKDEVAMTLDFDLNLVLHTGPYIDVEVGFFYSRWTDLPEFNLTRTNNSIFSSAPSIMGEDRDHLSWSGAQVKLRFHI